MYGLGEIIAFLEKQPQDKICPIGFHNPNSYRGYYEDLAFEQTENISIADMLACTKAALGSTYMGYKGGEFTMKEYTQCWISNYGEASGQSIGELLLRLIVDK